MAYEHQSSIPNHPSPSRASVSKPSPWLTSASVPNSDSPERVSRFSQRRFRPWLTSLSLRLRFNRTHLGPQPAAPSPWLTSLSSIPPYLSLSRGSASGVSSFHHGSGTSVPDSSSLELVSRLSQRAAPSPWFTTLGSGIKSISSPVSTDHSLRFLIIIATRQ